MGTYTFSSLHHIDSILWHGKKWGTGNTGTGATVTYRFSNRDDDAYTPHSVAQQARIKDAFNAWSEVANVTFSELTNNSAVSAQVVVFGGGGQTRPILNNQGISSAELDISSSGDLSPGSYEYGALALHEIGHALGLKHPHNVGSNGFNVIADQSIDSNLFTVMSYRSYAGQPDAGPYRQSFFPTTPMLNDIAAIQHIYGANWNTRSGNTVYRWNTEQQILETIWDGGGIDGSISFWQMAFLEEN